MSENEVNTEQLVESILEQSQSAEAKELQCNRWIALTSVLLSVISALCGLGASMSAHEASRLRDERTYSIAAHSGKRSVVHILQAQQHLLSTLNLPANTDMQGAIKELSAEAEELNANALLAAKTAEIEMHTHHLFEYASTMLGVAIGLCGLAIVLRRTWVWWISLGFGSIGSLLVLLAYIYRLSLF